MKRQGGAEEKKRSWFKAALLGFTGSAALIILLLQLTGLDWRALQGITLRADLIGLALAASALVWLLRGLRISALCAGVSLSDALAIVAAQGLLLRVTPLRLGDLGLPLLLERRGVPLGEALLLLLWVRLTELWVLGWLCLVALLGRLSEATTPLLVTLLFLTPLLALIHPLSLHVSGLICAIATKLSLDTRLPRVDQKLRALDRQLRAAERLPRRSWLILIASAGAILSAQGLLFWMLLLACGAELSYSAALLGTSLAHLAGALPLPTIGNLGTHEAGWVAGLTLVGLAQTVALQSALLSQGATLAFAVLWGLWGLRVLRRA